jgi:glycosyltransferase involved in cell wall biosynthesis
MKVAFLLGSLNRGGTETLLLDIFRNSKSHELDAIGIYRKTGALEKEFQESGLKLYKLSDTKNPIKNILFLRKLLLKNEIQIAHAQQPIDALYARLACLGTSIKIVLTLHGYDFGAKGLGLTILKYIIRRTDANIYVSNSQRQYYQEKYKLKCVKQQMVYNGISFNKLDMNDIRGAIMNCTTNQKALRAELLLSTDTLLLGSVGNFVDGRDQYTLCRFLKFLNEQEVDFNFVFVGKKDYNMPHLYDDCFTYCHQNKLSDKVNFLGSRNDVPAILQELDAFIYSTDHDTFGIAVIEAMATGIPVLVNDWGVMKEITEDGKYATLYKTKDEADLLQQFMLFLQNREQYKIKAMQARVYVQGKFSIENHIKQLKKVYDELMVSD